MIKKIVNRIGLTDDYDDDDDDDDEVFEDEIINMKSMRWMKVVFVF